MIRGKKAFKMKSDEHRRDFIDHNITLNTLWQELFPMGVPFWLTCETDKEYNDAKKKYEETQRDRLDSLMTIWNNTFYGG